MSDLVSDGQQQGLASSAFTEGLKAMVAIGGSVWASVSLNNLVALATLVFVFLQTAYLLWKWRREALKRA